MVNSTILRRLSSRLVRAVTLCVCLTVLASCVSFWPGSVTEEGGNYRVYVDSDQADPTSYYFDTYEDAKAFQNWLSNNTIFYSEHNMLHNYERIFGVPLRSSPNVANSPPEKPESSPAVKLEDLELGVDRAVGRTMPTSNAGN